MMLTHTCSAGAGPCTVVAWCVCRISIHNLLGTADRNCNQDHISGAGWLGAICQGVGRGGTSLTLSFRMVIPCSCIASPANNESSSTTSSSQEGLWRDSGQVGVETLLHSDTRTEGPFEELNDAQYQSIYLTFAMPFDQFNSTYFFSEMGDLLGVPSDTFR